jgi:hypothetical protein
MRAGIVERIGAGIVADVLIGNPLSQKLAHISSPNTRHLTDHEAVTRHLVVVKVSPRTNVIIR